MRDLLFIVVFPFLVFATLKRPFIGVAMWVWIAMHFPNGWMYSFGSGIRYNLIIVIVTVISYLILKNKPKVEWDLLTSLILLFLVWTAITSAFTISYPFLVWPEWIEFLKISLCYFFAIFILKSKLHINTLIWALVFSIGFYGCLEGLKYIVSGGAHRIHGLRGHVLGDRNELALAFNMVLPLLVYLITVSKNKLIKIGLKCAVVLVVIAIFGTFSRGGLVALFAVGGYFWLQSNRKFLYAALFLIGFSASSSFLPSEWHDRMDTIETAQEDSSFLGRILAWKQAVLMANENPITGGGFKAGQVGVIWFKYPAAESFNNIIDTSHLSEIGFKAAHSIYFQVLGDHGYIGLTIFMSILITGFFKAGSLVRRAKEMKLDNSTVQLCSLLRVSIIAYGAGGAGVSLAYFDALYAILAIIYVLDHRIVKQKSSVFIADSVVDHRA